MANLITLFRLVLLAAVVTGIYNWPPQLQLWSLVLLVLAFLTDGLDGYIARGRGEETPFGAMFDIASDRIVELTLWVVFVDLQIVPVWVVLVFIARGILVDTIRSTQNSRNNTTPFLQMTSRIGTWLVAGKAMRFWYAVVKATTFCWLLLAIALETANPTFFAQWGQLVADTGSVLVYLSVSLCVLRGIPVIAEFLIAERQTVDRSVH